MPKQVNETIEGYDLVGGTHSDNDPFLSFLKAEGYERRNRTLHHPRRKAIALGDFPTHGTGQSLFLETVNQVIGQQDFPAITDGRRFLLRCDVDDLCFHLYFPAEKNGGLRLAKSGQLEEAAKGKLIGLAIEVIRERYLPQIVTTLFVGESAPQSGAFFYGDENSMLSQMRLVMEARWEKFSGKREVYQLGKSEEFLQTFKAAGWYLDDLVLEPIDHLSRMDRQFKCCVAVEGLARRIKHYNPQATVVLLLSMEPFVKCAVHAAGSAAPVYPVHFPGMGFAPHFREDMAKIIEILPPVQQFQN